MAVRLFVGNLSYSTTEADLRTYFGTVAPPSQVVLPVDRETGRPRGFAFVEYHRSRARRAGDPAVQRPGVQRTAARRQRGARARGSRSRRPRPRPGRVTSRRPARGPAASRRGRRLVRRSAASVRPVGAARRRAAATSDPTPSRSAAATPRPRRRTTERPRGPIPLKATGRSFTLDDDSPDEAAAGHRRFRHQQAARGRTDEESTSPATSESWDRILVALRDLDRRGELPSLVRRRPVRQRLR